MNAAKALALTLELPLVGVNHLEGHVYAAWLEEDPPDRELGFPLLCLIASGGHTDLVLDGRAWRVPAAWPNQGRRGGGGLRQGGLECWGWGFPGGPEIQRVSEGAVGRERLPRAWLRGTLDFSFSGLKTALLHKAQAACIYPPGDLEEEEAADMVRELAAAFQESVVDVLTAKTLRAASEFGAKGVILGGGGDGQPAAARENSGQGGASGTDSGRLFCVRTTGPWWRPAAYYQLNRGAEGDMDMEVDPSLSLG